MRQKIHFTGKNLNDVFFLHCVSAIIKTDNDELFIILRKGMYDGTPFACIGEWLVEDNAGKWHVEKEAQNDFE